MLNLEALSPVLRLRTALDSLGSRVRSGAQAIPGRFRTPTIALLVAGSYYAGSQIGFLLTPADSPISTFWPPNAILLAVFLLTPPRIWWALLVAVLPAHLFIQLSIGIPVISSLGWFVGNTGEALMGAVGVRLFSKDKSLFESVHGVMVFLVFGVFLPTVATSFLDAAAAVRIGLGRNYWMLWMSRFTSNTVADLTIVPTIVIFRYGLSWFRTEKIWAYFEASVLSLSTVLIGLWIFSRGSSATSIPAFIYAPLLLLLWAAVRFGYPGLSTSMLTIALISSWNTVHGRGPLGTYPMVDGILSLRVLLAVFAVPLMLLAALLAERHMTEETVRVTRRKLIGGQEQQRYRVARKLHDDIVQRLILVGLHVDKLRAESNLFGESLDEVYDQLSGVSEATRELSHDLHPFVLEYLGLPGALRKMCRDFSNQSGIAVDLAENCAQFPLTKEVSMCLYRVASQALRNVAQHSRAQKASLEVKVDGGLAVLRISDDGIGMDPKRGEGIGLTDMRDHLQALGGSLEITSGPFRGTLIAASVPIVTSP